MEKKQNYIIGLDLGESYAQVSYVSFEGEEGDKYNIPMCLCKRNGANQWLYGEEALRFAATGKGVAVNNLLSLALAGESVIVEDKEADPVELLDLFIKNALLSLGVYEEGVCVKVLAVSLDELTPRVLEIFERMKGGSMRNFEEVYLVTKEESLFYYMVHQPKELRSYESLVLDLSGNTLKTYRIEMNYRTKPILTTIEEAIHEEISIPNEFASIMEKDRYLEETDAKLYEIMSGMLEGKIVTGVYLVGKIFEKEWCPLTLKLLCKNRRVFGGSNLYSKGACLGGMEKIAPGETAGAYVYLGKEKLKSDIGVCRMEQGRNVVDILLHGGINWFDASVSFTFMPGEDHHLPIVIAPMDGSKERVVPVVLPEFADRDVKSLKFACKLSMRTDKELAVEIEDIGFGEFYKPTGRKFEEIILLGGNA